MEFQELFNSLKELGDYRVTMALSCDEDGDDIYATRVEVDGMKKGVLSYKGELESLNAAVKLVYSNGENVKDHSSAAEVLKATLDELGFDKAVALLERLNRL